MFNKKMQYVIKTVPVEDKKALENLLNEMSSAGWDLYTMHEVETEDSLEFNCIFMREKQEEETTNLDDIVNITSFKYRMEKMLAAPTSPYESCKEIQLKISNQKERIKKIKSQLESDNLSIDDKNRINLQMSDELRQLDSLKQALVNEISPDAMYSTIKEEKFTVCLSEEILQLVSMENSDNLLSETVKVRQNLKDKLGYVIPHIHFHNSDDLAQNEFSIKLHDVEVFRGFVFPKYRMFLKEDLKGYKVKPKDIASIDSLTGKKAIWIEEEKVKDFWQNGISAIEYVGKVIEEISIREVSDIMDYNDVNKYLEIVAENNSFLIENLMPDYLNVADLKYLLTCLIRERVSIKNIVYLFEKINDYANEPTKEDLYSKVRLAFSKLILKDLIQDGKIKYIKLSEASINLFTKFFEKRIDEDENFEEEENDDFILRIEANGVNKLADRINKFVKNKILDTPIITAPMELRHIIFVVLSEFIPNITVLAQEEIINECDCNVVGTV